MGTRMEITSRRKFSSSCATTSMTWRRINGWENDDWIDNTAWSVDGFQISYCYGHNLADVLSWPKHIYSPNYGPYTNADVLTITHPDNDAATYVYDNFEWPHCEENGYLRTLIETDIITSTDR